MFIYSIYLDAGANEITEHLATHRDRLGNDAPYWERLADEMRNAAKLSNTIDAENAIHGIARLIIDEFPIDVDFAPSFGVAMKELQNAERQRRRESRA